MNEGWSGKTGIHHTMCQAADAAQTLEYSLLPTIPSKHTPVFLQAFPRFTQLAGGGCPLMINKKNH